jgi:maltose operon periplasmic protein
MKVLHCLLLVGCLTACETLAPVFDTSTKTLTVAEGQSELQGSSICCHALSELPFIDITKDSNENYQFDHTAPAFQFVSGKSFVRAFRLPLNIDAMSVEFSALITKSVFVPTVDFYNPKMELVKRIESSAFSYKPARLIQGDTLEAHFMITNLTAAEEKKIAFMVIYTTDEAQQGETKVIHPAKLFAMANGTVPPDIADPMIPHAATGSVNVTLTLNSSGFNLLNRLDDPLIGESSTKEGEVLNTAVDQSVVLASPGQANSTTAAATATATNAVTNTSVSSVSQQAPVMAPAANPVASGTMLAETEALYNQLIIKAVSNGDIEKAMALAGEAERAGSRTAKATLIDAIKNSQK